MEEWLRNKLAALFEYPPETPWDVFYFLITGLEMHEGPTRPSVLIVGALTKPDWDDDRPNELTELGIRLGVKLWFYRNPSPSISQMRADIYQMMHSD